MGATCRNEKRRLFNRTRPRELDFASIVKHIDAMGYSGYFGLEYWPTGDAAASLARTKKALTGA